MRPSLLLFTTLFVLVLSPLAAFAEADADAYRDGYQHILDEDWSAAATAFDNMITSYPNSDWADDATFWKCYANEHTGTSDDASFGCYERFMETYSDSEWTDDAERHLVRLARRLAQQGRPEYRDRIRELENHTQDEKLLTVLMALAEIGDQRSLDVIFDRIARTDDEHRRAAIISVLDDVDGEAGNLVVSKLKSIMASDPSHEVRATALMALSEYDDHPGVEGLLREVAMDSGQPSELRAVALHQLEDFESADLASFLEKLARTADDPSLAAVAVDTLGELETPAADAALRNLFASSDSQEVQAAVVEAIADREDSTAVEFLVRVAEGDDPEMAHFAVSRLGDVDATAALDALQRIARTGGDWRLQATAVAALGEQESEVAVGVLENIARQGGDPRLRRAAIHALADTDLDSAIPILVDLSAGDTDPDVRRDAAHALGEIGSDAAREALIELLDKVEGD